MSCHHWFSICLWILTANYAFSLSVYAEERRSAPVDTQVATPSSTLIERGAYLAQIGGCVSCHSVDGQPELSGGKEFITAFGSYYSSNLRSDDFLNDPRWHFSAFKQALTQGIAPDGRSYYPVFPYASFSALKDADVRALFVYFKSQRVVENRVPEHQPSGLAMLSWSVSLWRYLYVGETRIVRHEDKNAMLRDGQYLVDAVLHCGECHTPRNRMGAKKKHAYLRGATLANGHFAPNLRPSEDGLLLWEISDIQRYLRTGKSEWGQNATDEMKEYIDTVSRHLTEQDSLSIATYLQQLGGAPTYPRCRVHGPRSTRC